jgi:hypothetical protein
MNDLEFLDFKDEAEALDFLKTHNWNDFVAEGSDSGTLHQLFNIFVFPEPFDLIELFGESFYGKDSYNWLREYVLGD